MPRPDRNDDGSSVSYYVLITAEEAEAMGGRNPDGSLIRYVYAIDENGDAIGVGGGGETYPDAVLADNPIGYWRLGETSGASAADLADTPHNGSFAGGVTLNQAGAVPGGKAASFDGSDDRVSVPATAAFNNLAAPFTLEIWAKPADRVGYYGLINKTDGGVSRQFEWVLNASGGQMWFVVAGVLFQGTGIPAVNEWSHLVAVYDYIGSPLFGLRLYINGRQTDAIAAVQAVSPSSQPLEIGRAYAGTWPFKGELAEAAVYDYRLSADRIMAHYLAGIGALTTSQAP